MIVKKEKTILAPHKAPTSNNPAAERQDVDDDESPYAFNGTGDTDLQIVSTVRKEIKEEVDVESDNEDLDANVTGGEVEQLRKFRAHLRREDMLKSTAVCIKYEKVNFNKI